MLSTLGSAGVSPYAELDPAYTKRVTPASRAAISMFSVPVAHASWEAAGFATLRGTEGNAA